MPTKTTEKEETKKTVTIDFEGFKLEADVEALDDVETLEAVEKIQAGEVAPIRGLMIKALGENQYDELKAYFIEKDGRMKIGKLTKLFELIFKEFDPKG